MANLLDTAELISDLYYQNYKTDEDFFSLDHFAYLSGVAYSKILEDEYKLARKEMLQAEGFAEIFLQEDWTVEKTLELKPDPDDPEVYSAPLPNRLFTFPYDPYAFGIQNVRRERGTACSQFVRTSLRETWLDCQMPYIKNRVFFYVSGGTFTVTNVKCKLDKVIVSMVPEITDESFGASGGPVPKSKEDDIIRKTLEILFKAREGTVVDMSNNSNPNKAMQTEVDNVFQNLKTKPI